MWRLYDGLSEVSQYEIGGALGICEGANTQYRTLGALGLYTRTGTDAYYDVTPILDESEFFARQITSIDRRIPVMPLVNWGGHSGILNGGKWSEDSLTGLYTWLSVKLHDPDPLIGANKNYIAGDWTSRNCADFCRQLISLSGTLNWDANLIQWGDELRIRGRRDWPPNDWPPEI